MTSKGRKVCTIHTSDALFLTLLSIFSDVAYFRHEVQIRVARVACNDSPCGIYIAGFPQKCAPVEAYTSLREY